MIETARISRAQRREIQKLAAKVKKVTQSDRKFFDRFPHREYRLRPAHPAEVEQERIARGKIEVKAGHRAYTVVKSLCRGSRLRMVIQAGPNFYETDADDDTARLVWRQFETDDTRAVEAEMRATTCGDGALAALIG